MVGLNVGKPDGERVIGLDDGELVVGADVAGSWVVMSPTLKAAFS